LKGDGEENGGIVDGLRDMRAKIRRNKRG